MKQLSTIKILIGGFIVLAGVFVLLDNLDIFKFNSWNILWNFFWSSFFFITGIKAIQTKVWPWAVLCFAISITTFLAMFGIVTVSFWKIFWPLIIICLGLTIAFSISPKVNKSTKNLSAIFWSNETKITDKFDGSSLLAIFGGVDLDLRQAKITNDCVIEVFTMFGGIDIKLPDNIILDDQVMGIFGGSENKTNPSKTAQKKLTVKGQCIFGGVELI